MNSNVNSVTRIPLVLAAATLISCVWSVSTCFGGEPPRAETVKFQDLDVSTSEGVQALYARIHAAARRVCSTSDPIQHLGANDCAKTAEARAVANVGLPQLTAFYRMQAGVHAPPLSASR